MPQNHEVQARLAAATRLLRRRCRFARCRQVSIRPVLAQRAASLWRRSPCQCRRLHTLQLRCSCDIILRWLCAHRQVLHAASKPGRCFGPALHLRRLRLLLLLLLLK
jgi:hypothetical protein